MGQFLEWLMAWFREFKFFVTILPWERAIRVRLGNRVKLWEPGWHIKLPFVDNVTVINTRLRISVGNMQTLTTADGKCLTIGVAVGFFIKDPCKAMLRMHAPEQSISALTESVVSQVVTETQAKDLTTIKIEEFVIERLQEQDGYEFEFVKVSDFAYTRTYRLLNDNAYRGGFTIDERKL
jgi:regulator of protease activity HflC (stomatin/prohibitin superfamily)